MADPTPKTMVVKAFQLIKDAENASDQAAKRARHGQDYTDVSAVRDKALDDMKNIKDTLRKERN